MSNQSIRQSELFSGEDWTVLYRAFNQINFNSYDPASINTALREYIRTNYPEDFNDWTENSEFVAIIDLLSYLAGSLAFRTDVNARENFLETAQARESILRLARFLSYNPRRAQSGRGLLKVVSLSTTQSLQDSFGMNLNNRTITWNDPDNVDWLEQFTVILNATFPTTNPYGIPFKSVTIGGAASQLYRLNSTTNEQASYSFNASVDGESDEFEIVNIDIASDNSGFIERPPVPTQNFSMLYRNDGRGNASTRTGFFMMFKQGSLRTDLYTIGTPVENRVLDIDTQNISETDVWVQTVDDNDTVTSQWTKVPGLFGDNITFNSISADVRDIFSVVTRTNDQISLRFGDGRFGNAPVGNLKVWYRTVNGLQYTIRPSDMANVSIDIPYTDVSGRAQTLTVGLALQETTSNALGAEDLEQVRRRAPQVYGAQNRMVSGEDYNVFPLSSNEAIKLRAVNRVYSGHSRFLDINDPTSTFQDTVVFADDGIIYRQVTGQYTQVPITTSLTAEQLVDNKIQPMLGQNSLRDYITDLFLTDPTTTADTSTFGNKLVWNLNSGSGYSSAGFLSYSPSTDDDSDVSRFKKYLAQGCKIQFGWTDPVTNLAKTKWVDVTAVTSSSRLSDRIISVDDAIPGKDPLDTANQFTARVLRIVPAFRNSLDSRPMTHLVPVNSTEIDLVKGFLTDTIPFKIFYRYSANSVLAYGGTTLPGQWVIQSSGTAAPQDAELIMSASYLGGLFWSFEVPVGLRYIFESTQDVRWHALTTDKVVDGAAGQDYRDTLTVLWSDAWAQEIDSSLRKPITLDIVGNVYDPDGFPDYRKVVVTPTDSDADGSQDDPSSISRLITDQDFTIYSYDYTTTYNTLVPTDMMVVNSTYETAGELNDGDMYFVRGNATFYTYTPSGTHGIVLDANNPTNPLNTNGLPIYRAINGRNGLKFQWKHFAGRDVRIDPAPTNIVDIFVLSSEYDYQVRQWIKEGAVASDLPEPPTNLDLKLAFSEYEQYKMFSDEMVWRPVKYKYLFGEGAVDELKAQFKIVRLANPALSDGEIRSRVITAINNYFDVNRWEFGETFYFTELAAYLHVQLSTSISSVVIVPSTNAGKFGELFEVRSETDEVFISTAQVNDVVIIDSNTASNLRIS